MFDRFEQISLSQEQITLREKLNFYESSLYEPKNGDIIYTLDVIYKDSIAHIGCDIVAYPNRHIKTISLETPSSGTYVPGYFSFYEGPVLISAFEEVSKREPRPDLIIVDGHGLAHPRKFGLACYVGVKLDIPTIGIAKQNLLPFDRETLPKEKYAQSDFVVEDETVGVVIRLQKDTKPIFISPGNKISLTTSIEIIKELTTDFKNPDNMRRADMASRRMRQE